MSQWLIVEGNMDFPTAVVKIKLVSFHFSPANFFILSCSSKCNFNIGRIDFEKETPAADLSVLGSLYLHRPFLRQWQID